MRIRHLLGIGLAFVVVVGSCNTATSPPKQSAASSLAEPTGSAATPVSATTAAAGPVGEVVAVTGVIDGDTFRVSDGRTIRVLGIDSCEKSTYGGEEAQRMADSQLKLPGNQPIRLVTQPGVDKDRYGRHLRYVVLAGGYDFGEEMVAYEHTGVYQAKKQDASDEYMRSLRVLDTKYSVNTKAGRLCEDPYEDGRSSGGGGTVDLNNGNGRDGALTGGFCSHRRWC